MLTCRNTIFKNTNHAHPENFSFCFEKQLIDRGVDFSACARARLCMFWEAVQSVMHSPHTRELLFGGESTREVGPEAQARVATGVTMCPARRRAAIRAVEGFCKRVSRQAGVLKTRQASRVSRLVVAARGADCGG